MDLALGTQYLYRRFYVITNFEVGKLLVGDIVDLTGKY